MSQLIGFRDFLLETGIIQDLPPDYDIQSWIHENREVYHKEHGKDEGERILFSKAWQNYNAINSSTENSD